MHQAPIQCARVAALDRGFNTHFSSYSPYVQHLTKLAYAPEMFVTEEWKYLVDVCLDGGSSRELRKCVSLKELREVGAFFTGRSLARHIVRSLCKNDKPNLFFFDPACGAGDLLLEVARYFPLCPTLDRTINVWGRRLAGCEKIIEFVQVAKLRLLLLAMTRHGLTNDKHCSIAMRANFPQITCSDGLEEVMRYRNADIILMNPPFTMIGGKAEYPWTSGRINMAAIFVHRALALVQEGTRINAILPDVLRSGSRYANWRVHIERHADLLAVRPYGLFDRWTDVDVFIVALEKRTDKGTVGLSGGWNYPSKSEKLVSDYFHVHVGPVVPHRHKDGGPILPYLHARGLPQWTSLKENMDRRNFQGTTYAAPFVAVRRTSRPGDKKRAVGCIISGDQRVAVENHLIVLVPHDGSLKTCKQLLERLKCDKTDSWLDKRIRCRHLTVKALADLPWWE